MPKKSILIRGTTTTRSTSTSGWSARRAAAEHQLNTKTARRIYPSDEKPTPGSPMDLLCQWLGRFRANAKADDIASQSCLTSEGFDELLALLRDAGIDATWKVCPYCADAQLREDFGDFRVEFAGRSPYNEFEAEWLHNLRCAVREGLMSVHLNDAHQDRTKEMPKYEGAKAPWNCRDKDNVSLEAFPLSTARAGKRGAPVAGIFCEQPDPRGEAEDASVEFWFTKTSLKSFLEWGNKTLRELEKSGEEAVTDGV